MDACITGAPVVHKGTVEAFSGLKNDDNDTMAPGQYQQAWFENEPLYRKAVLIKQQIPCGI